MTLGFSFGAAQSVAGEVVFNTGMAPGTEIFNAFGGFLRWFFIWDKSIKMRKTRLVWFYMVLYGFIWFYMVLYGFIWFYMVLYGFIWFYMVLYGFYCEIMWFLRVFF